MQRQVNLYIWGPTLGGGKDTKKKAAMFFTGRKPLVSAGDNLEGGGRRGRKFCTEQRP